MFRSYGAMDAHIFGQGFLYSSIFARFTIDDCGQESFQNNRIPCENENQSILLLCMCGIMS